MQNNNNSQSQTLTHTYCDCLSLLLKLLNLKYLSYFSGAHFSTFACQLGLTYSLTHSLSLSVPFHGSVSNFSFSICMYVSCVCVRAYACTVVYFTVLCEQRHLLYEQFELHRILWWCSHILCVLMHTYRYTNSLSYTKTCWQRRMFQCMRAHILCISFDFGLKQSTLPANAPHWDELRVTVSHTVS